MGQTKGSEETKTIDIDVKDQMADELERRANSMRLSTSTYCRIILQQCIASEKEFQLE